MLKCVCFKYQGVSTEEVHARTILSSAHVITPPVLDSTESQGACTQTVRIFSVVTSSIRNAADLIAYC